MQFVWIIFTALLSAAHAQFQTFPTTNGYYPAVNNQFRRSRGILSDEVREVLKQSLGGAFRFVGGFPIQSVAAKSIYKSSGNELDGPNALYKLADIVRNPQRQQNIQETFNLRPVQIQPIFNPYFQPLQRNNFIQPGSQTRFQSNSFQFPIAAGSSDRTNNFQANSIENNFPSTQYSLQEQQNLNIAPLKFNQPFVPFPLTQNQPQEGSPSLIPSHFDTNDNILNDVGQSQPKSSNAKLSLADAKEVIIEDLQNEGKQQDSKPLEEESIKAAKEDTDGKFDTLLDSSNEKLGVSDEDLQSKIFDSETFESLPETEKETRGIENIPDIQTVFEQAKERVLQQGGNPNSIQIVRVSADDIPGLLNEQQGSLGALSALSAQPSLLALNSQSESIPRIPGNVKVIEVNSDNPQPGLIAGGLAGDLDIQQILKTSQGNNAELDGLPPNVRVVKLDRSKVTPEILSQLRSGSLRPDDIASLRALETTQEETEITADPATVTEAPESVTTEDTSDVKGLINSFLQSDAKRAVFTLPGDDTPLNTTADSVEEEVIEAYENFDSARTDE